MIMFPLSPKSIFYMKIVDSVFHRNMMSYDHVNILYHIDRHLQTTVFYVMCSAPGSRINISVTSITLLDQVVLDDFQDFSQYPGILIRTLRVCRFVRIPIAHTQVALYSNCSIA